MKKKIFALTTVFILLSVGCISVEAAKPEFKGNGLPRGKSYNLNIIGVPNVKNDNFDGGNGARIFVKRTGPTQFFVFGGDAYEIKLYR